MGCVRSGRGKKRKLETRRQKVESGKEKRDFIPQNARDGEEFSHPQADRIAGAMRVEKASACSVRNEGVG
jgi:hypothetical protein